MASKKILALAAVLLLIAVPVVLAQEIDYCEGDYNCDGDQDGSDAYIFKADFGRSSYSNPCPSCTPLTPIPKTGQTSCYDGLGNIIACAGTGQDGEYQLGYERFTDNMDGTVTDNFTKLIWLKDVDCMATHYPSFDTDGTVDTAVTWQHALDFIKGVNNGTYGLCSADHDDWRLPNINELRSIIDNIAFSTLMPSNHPFYHIQPYTYWSSTTVSTNYALALYVYAYRTNPTEAQWEYGNKNEYRFVWQVRNGQ